MTYLIKTGTILAIVLSVGANLPAAHAQSLPPSVLQAMERALNDEWDAENFYAAVIEKHGNVRPFANIILAEQKHASMLVALYQKYGATIPENPYKNGAKAKPAAPSTLAEACEIGVAAEIANRDLYANDLMSAAAGHADVLAVFEALRAASENNHLPAFQRCGGNN